MEQIKEKRTELNLTKKTTEAQRSDRVKEDKMGDARGISPENDRKRSGKLANVEKQIREPSKGVRSNQKAVRDTMCTTTALYRERRV